MLYCDWGRALVRLDAEWLADSRVPYLVPALVL